MSDGNVYEQRGPRRLFQSNIAARGRLVPVPLWLMLPAFIFLCVFFVGPLLYLLELTDTGRRTDTSPYWQLVSDPFYRGVIFQTLGLSFAVASICIVVGYPIAVYLVRHAGRSANLIIFLLMAPLLTSIVMRTYGWRVLLARQGLVNSILQSVGITDMPVNFLNSAMIVVTAMVHVLVPFAVLSIASVLQNIDRRLEESAAVLGANKLRTFFYVTFPLSLEGVATGFIFVFMIANGTFITPLLLGGGSVQTLPLLIYQQFNQTRDIGFAAAMGNVLLLLAIASLFIQMRLIRSRGTA